MQTGGPLDDGLQQPQVIRFALHIVFFLSGAAALGYQIVWAKMFSTGLGHEMPAVLAIVAAFMAGMALGAWGLDRFIPRDGQAGFWLAGIELTIGVWALLASFFIPSANEFAMRLIGLTPGAVRHWFVAFAVPVIALLPATAAMGATLPAMEKFLSVVAPRHESIGSVYAANTFGAVGGTLLAPFVLMPKLGFSESCWVLAVVNGVVSAAAFMLTRTQRVVSPTAQPRAEGLKRAPCSSGRLALSLFITGLLGIGYEVAGVRVLTQVLEGTVFTYAAVLAVFLLGTAAGAGAYHRLLRRVEPNRSLARLLWALCVTCLLGIFALSHAKPIYAAARGLGDTPFAVLAAELLTAAAVFLLPTFFMGATFSHLTQLAREQRGRIGEFVALNTMGAALAPAVCGVMFVPLLGTKSTLICIALGYLALGFRLPQWKCALAALPFLVLTFNSDLQIVDKPSRSKVLTFREGVMASVAVVEDSTGARTLRVDNRFQMGGTAAADAEYRQAHIPLLLHPAPQRALFLGIGTGISLGAATLYPELKSDGVELVPEVIEVMPAFEPFNFAPGRQTNLTLHAADARRFVRTAEARYDVIVADVFHPYRDGAGALYTREHFAVIRARLNTNGLFCQWLPLHQLDGGTLRIITHTFLEVFPNAEAWLLRLNVDVPVIGLVGRNGGTSYSNNWVEVRTQSAPLADAIKRMSLADSVRFFGNLVAGPEELRQFAAHTAINSDDHQHVTFLAPRLTYQRDAKPYASLLALLDAKDLRAAEQLHLRVVAGDREFAEKVLKYSRARDVYLRGLVDDAEGRDDEAVAAYIESARLSADFTSGYAQCLSIASLISRSDPARARRILERLIEAQPARPVAADLLKRLSLE